MITRFRAISETETFACIEYIHHSRITQKRQQKRKAQEEGATHDDDGTQGPLPHSSKDARA